MLLDRPPFLVAGLVLGLCVVTLFALINRRLGVTGGFSDLVERASGRTAALGWPAFFVFGVAAGGLLFLLLAGGDARLEGYGWLTRTFDGDARVLVAPILVLAGVLIGFGAKRAGGCTSGNGLSASSFGSPAGLVAMASFMASAVAVSFAIEALR